MTRYELFGVPIDALTMDETVERCAELVAEKRPVQHVVLNALKVVTLAEDPRIADIVRSCDLVSADGQSVVWAGRLLGVPVPERVAGIDLMERLIERAEVEGWPVYFLGATRQVLDEFLSVVRSRYPALDVAGHCDGYFDDDAAVAEAIRASGARMLFVGMPSPRKELFLAENLRHMGPVFGMGVGGSFDVWAGKTARAPRWMQRSGLEWAYRFIQEPRRMWRRALVTNSRFLVIVLREWLRLRRDS